MEDKLIIKHIKKRKEKGLEELIEKYAGLIKSVIRKYLFNLNGYEEECLDDILLSIWNNIDSYDEKKNEFRNWIISVSKYRAIDYKRKYLKNLEELRNIDFKEIKDNKKIEENILKKEFLKDVEELLHNLNEKDRKIFEQLYIEEKSIDEVGYELELEKSYIYNRVSRGRRQLRKLVSIKKFL